MALPVIPKLEFEVRNKYLPNGKIRMIPFGVGQEQHLIQMKDSTSNKDKIAVMRQIIEECIKTPGVTISKLPLFVVEEIFLRLKQYSSGEIVELAYECTNALGDDKQGGVEICKNKIKLELDVREFSIKEHEGHTKKVIISDPIGVMFKYPDIDMMTDEIDVTDDTQLILSCIDMIFDADNVYHAHEYAREELLEFWNQLTLPQKKDVYEKFFLSMPNMHYKKELKCDKCGHVHNIEFNSLSEVFT